MRLKKPDLSDRFSRVNTRITKVVKKRLQLACIERQAETARQVTEGEIIVEMAMRDLKPHPDEQTKPGRPKVVATNGKRKPASPARPVKGRRKSA